MELQQIAQAVTALQALRAIIGADKVGRHDAIVVQVATIAALALADQPPKGLGNPADHAKVAQCFTEANMPRYAQACIGFTTALRVKGFRSLSWEDAQTEGLAMADAMLADLRPRVLSKAEAKAKEAKAAARKATKVEEAKAEAAAAQAKADEAKAAELRAAYERGQSEPRPITAENVADLIRAGAFDTQGLQVIAAALKGAPVDVPAREVALIGG